MGTKESAERGDSGWLRALPTRAWALMAAFGVLSAIGGYYMPGLLTWLGERSGRPPVTITVKNYGEFPSAHSPALLMPVGTVLPEDVPPKMSERAYEAWARDKGALYGQDQLLRLTIQGRDDRPVIIQSIKARVLTRGEAPAGWFRTWGGCGGVEAREARIDLDQDPPRFSFRSPGSEELTLTLKVSATDPEVIDVTASTHQGDVRWVLDIGYEQAGRSGEITVDDRGKPFRVVALTTGRAESYGHNVSEPVRSPDRDPVRNFRVGC